MLPTEGKWRHFMPPPFKKKKKNPHWLFHLISLSIRISVPASFLMFPNACLCFSLPFLSASLIRQKKRTLRSWHPREIVSMTHPHLEAFQLLQGETQRCCCHVMSGTLWHSLCVSIRHSLIPVWHFPRPSSDQPQRSSLSASLCRYCTTTWPICSFYDKYVFIYFFLVNFRVNSLQCIGRKIVVSATIVLII